MGKFLDEEPSVTSTPKGKFLDEQQTQPSDTQQSVTENISPLDAFVTPKLTSRMLGTPAGQTAGQQFGDLYGQGRTSMDMPYGSRLLNEFSVGMAGDLLDQFITPSNIVLGAMGVSPTLRKITGVSAAGEALGNVGSKISQTIEDTITKRTPFLQDVRAAFQQAKSNAVQRFGQGLDRLAEDNPGVSVNLRPVIDRLQQEVALEPKLSSAVSRNPQLSSYLSNPELANEVPIQETQKLMNDLNSQISLNKLRGVGVRSTDIPLFDTLDDIRVSQMEAFPDIADLRSDYKSTINDYNTIREKTKVGSLDKNINSNFGDIELKDAANRLLSESPDILSRVKAMQGARLLGKFGAYLGGGSLGVGAIYKATH